MRCDVGEGVDVDERVDVDEGVELDEVVDGVGVDGSAGDPLQVLKVVWWEGFLGLFWVFFYLISGPFMNI